MSIDVRILRSSFNALAPRAEALARAFYAKLFERHPEVKPLFDPVDMADQTQKLVRALTVIVRSVDDTAVLSGFLMRMGRTHLEYGVIDEHYDMVGETLLDTLAEVAGSTAWTTAVENTWREAIQTVCELMRAGAASAEPVEAELEQGEPALVGAAAGQAGRESRSDAGSPVPRNLNEQLPVNERTQAAKSGVSFRQETAGGDPTDETKDPVMTLGTHPAAASSQAQTTTFAPGVEAAHFYALAEVAPICLFVENESGAITYLNAKGHEVFRKLAEGLGGGPEKFVGQNADVLTSRVANYPVLTGRATEARAAELRVGAEYLTATLSALTDATGRRIGVCHTWMVTTMATLERERAKTTELYLEAVNRVNNAVMGARTVEDAARAALDVLRETFGWAYGSFWQLNRKEKVLRFCAESGTVTNEFRRATESASFAEGVGLSGRAWRARDLVFTDDLSKMTDCVRAPAAQRAGVKSGFCFPILVSNEVIGTMDFFALNQIELDEERKQALGKVARTVSQAIENITRESDISRMRQMIEEMPTAIMLANTDLEIVYLNPASKKTLASLQKFLPVKVDDMVGTNIDVFHKNPAMQRGMLGDPDRNLPHRARIQVATETLDLLISPIRDQAGKYLGPMVTWSVITGNVKMADDFERDVKGVVQIVTASATEMQASSKAMTQVAEQTARRAQVVAAASEEATRNVETVSSAAEELSASIAEISRHVQEASKMTATAVQQATQTNTTIRDLGEASSQIGQVVKVITSIAQQTNLLALNATIEAARAGEAGKGFAVVANEVKELARQTAKATEEISQKITAIQSSTNVAVSAIGSIGETISKINEISTTIASAVEEQSAATSEISRNVAEAAKGTAEVSSNITGVSQAADEAGRAAGDILAAASGLSQESVKLDQVASSFLERMRTM
jgi:hemoglobin-like flavoprotein/putative methionine-R-sulfoxide reductase with GAF domain